MTAQAGIVLGGDHIRAVMVERGAETWRASAPISGIDSIGAAVAILLAGAPPGFRRASLRVCVTPAWSQVKPLPGVPPVKHARMATQIVRENQRAFFLSRGAPVAVADVVTRPDGTVWGAAFDRDAMVELTRALRAERLRVDRVIPMVVAISAPEGVAWVDGADHYYIEADSHGPVRIDRRTDAANAAIPPDDAIVAARAGRRLPLSWLPDPDATQLRIVTAVRVASAVSAVAVAAAFTLFGPGVRASRFSRAANAELAGALGTQRELAQTQGDLRRTTETLNRVAAFQASRGAMSRILGELSQSLPESTAVLAFHVDSAEGGFTAIAPRIADVLPEVTAMDEIVSPRIIGSVTRETIGGAHVERATFRFRRPSATPAPSAPKGTE